MPNTTNTQPDLTSLAARLMACVRGRHTYLLIYEGYRRGRPKFDFAALLDILIDDTHDSIASLSSLLRQMDQTPKSIGVNEQLLGQAGSRRGTVSRLNFILTGTGRSIEWYQQQQSSEDSADVQELWQDLIEKEKRHQAMTADLLGVSEIAGEPR